MKNQFPAEEETPPFMAGSFINKSPCFLNAFFEYFRIYKDKPSTFKIEKSSKNFNTDNVNFSNK